MKKRLDVKEARLENFSDHVFFRKMEVQEEVKPKITNCPSTAVDESLEGYVRCNRGLVLCKRYKVIFRSDLEDVIAKNKVCLISGGGSGHEPSQVGYVGKGMLTAAVCGCIFASPPAAAILHAIRRCSSSNGVLLIVTNYTGDRLNFGRAMEQAKQEGLKVKMVIVDDDAAMINRESKVGRRGLCGTMFVHKIAGALAENGQSLDAIIDCLNDLIKDIKTISISLSPCSIPGQKPTFHIPNDAIEFGLGVHGEPGIKKIQMTTSKQIIQEMICYMLETDGSGRIFKGKNVAVILNNLGTTTEMEINILSKDLINYLTQEEIFVKRFYVGRFVTSLEMKGISITMMLLDEERLRCLDSDTNAPGWQRNGIIKHI